MLGAIIGDIVGSRFEFDRGNKSRDFKLFTSESDFTDDSVMTVAVAEALMDAGRDADEKTVKKHIIRSMKKWGQKYPHAGYGANFIYWVLSDDPEPYGSLGNGSGMRVSAAGWLYDTIERTREVARWTAEVTHNHPEGIKGAESTASAIFMARKGASLDEIRDYIVKEFGYDLSRTLDDIRPNYQHVEDCMHTMPEAFECFLEADSYESTLRNVMYIGGDTDTLCAIAGAIAEAKWGIPHGIDIDAYHYMPQEMVDVVLRFMKFNGGVYPDRYWGSGFDCPIWGEPKKDDE
ncbi:ADP-ribosylglycohydrolase family protein [Butyrivibrio sp. AE2032]|uniref:ADP-ribosylglycohydrolase family protein n=1 Tax=Butyrivibrio sp. AE2032 TaxID=1458463 RepID=UPI00082FF294|nr:ADP-ribosylglycohydrolase family protein [Butyrivibrio sp. AE2032]